MAALGTRSRFFRVLGAAAAVGHFVRLRGAVDAHEFAVAEARVEGLGEAFECRDGGSGEGVGELHGLPDYDSGGGEGDIVGGGEFVGFVEAEGGEDDCAGGEVKIGIVGGGRWWTYGKRSQKAEMTMNLFRDGIWRPHTS